MARDFSVSFLFSVRATSASASLRYDVNASRLLGDDSVDVLLVALPTELMARDFSVSFLFSVRATAASASLRYDVNASRLLGDDSVDVLLVALSTDLIVRLLTVSFLFFRSFDVCIFYLTLRLKCVNIIS